MRICLLSLTYPPASTEGIPRQRQALAAELARLGHEVHVVTLGTRTRSREEDGAAVHEVAAPRMLRYLPNHAALDQPLTESQALLEGLLDAGAGRPFDVVDVPLWAAQGFLPQRRHPGPFVVWLQTTSAQLLKIYGRRPSPADHARMRLERDSLERAHGILGDSRAALDATLRDYGVRTSAPTGVAYLGLPPLDPTPEDRPQEDRVEALVVGRLERRKGTPVLFEVLPGLLRTHPHLRVRFVGRDNSESDGWKARHGATYPEFFRARYPELVGQVRFEGYVADERLNELYRTADMLIAPSLYESFGLIYLEAMRAGLPVATFAAGAAPEIFPTGERDGALLARAGDAPGLAAAAGRLAADAGLRRAVGAAGLARFAQGFTSRAMAEATLEFYERTVAHDQGRRGGRRPVYQVMEALEDGDAVSDIARRNARLLGELGEPPVVLARSSPPSSSGETAPLERALETPESRLIYHYWGFGTSVWMPRALAGPMALYYHNITPAAFFPPDSPLRDHVARGYAQLAAIADRFDLLIGDSRYNLSCLAPLLGAPRPALHIYPVVEREALLGTPYDRRFAEQLRAGGATNILFVGRVARNKRQDQLMRAFDAYARAYNPSARLWLVGSETFDRGYRDELEALRRSLPSGDRVVFTGKVGETQLHAAFRAADLLLCASEHEGFCVPIAQAMAFGVPVLALAAAAVPETVGHAGGLLASWEPEAVAGRVHAIVSDSGERSALLAAQEESLARFSAAEARARLAAAVAFLREGATSALFEQVGP